MTVVDVPAAPALHDDFRSFFRRYAAGVVIITAFADAGPVGFTASSFASVSAAPPMVSFNISKTSSSWSAVQAATHVAIHRLTSADADLAALFAAKGAARFDKVAWSRDEYGVPVIKGPENWLSGAVVHRVDAGDSAVVVAEVLAVNRSQDATRAERTVEHPLVYATGSYAKAVPLGWR